MLCGEMQRSRNCAGDVEAEAEAAGLALLGEPLEAKAAGLALLGEPLEARCGDTGEAQREKMPTRSVGLGVRTRGAL